MSWSIQIPYRDRSEPLSKTAGAARHLPTDDERIVARQIVFDAMERGVRTAGDLLDELGGMEPSRRREVLSSARKTAGLPSIETVEARQQVQGVRRVDVDPSLQSCHAKNCGAIPLTESGSWRRINCRRWFCDQHIDQAALETWTIWASACAAVRAAR